MYLIQFYARDYQQRYPAHKPLENPIAIFCLKIRNPVMAIVAVSFFIQLVQIRLACARIINKDVEEKNAIERAREGKDQ